MEPYIGEIRIVPQSVAPNGWALCNGQIMQIEANKALFAILGNTYGGDGSITFALPDLRGRVALGFGLYWGAINYVQGHSSGSTTNVLTTSNLPQHRHDIHVSKYEGTSSSPTNNYFALANTGDNEYASNSDGTVMAKGVLSTEGQGQPVPNMQPYLTLSFIIALAGVFPSRQ